MSCTLLDRWGQAGEAARRRLDPGQLEPIYLRLAAPTMLILRPLLVVAISWGQTLALLRGALYITGRVFGSRRNWLDVAALTGRMDDEISRRRRRSVRVRGLAVATRRRLGGPWPYGRRR